MIWHIKTYNFNIWPNIYMWVDSQDPGWILMCGSLSSLKDWDWIHPESLASDEVWQVLLDLASDNVAVVARRHHGKRS